jgi:6-phosphogluconolactonase
MVANYSEGNVASYPIRGDGSIGEAGSVIQHTGTSADKSRQEGPHAHSITVDPAGRYAFSADLGIDKIFCYKLDPAAGKMTPGETPSTAVTPGAGPRHFAFTPDGRFAYVINELDSTVIAYAYEGAAGKLNQLQIVTTLPHDWKGTNYPADIHVSPDSRFVYGSNRGHNSLAIFAVDRTRGTLTAVGHEPTRGQHPRGFNISPRGDFLLAANQDTSNLLTFRVDAQTGKLSVAGQIIVMPRPVCVQMIEV